MPVSEMGMNLEYWEYRKKSNMVDIEEKKGGYNDIIDINRDHLLEGLVGHRKEHGVYPQHNDNPGKGFQMDSDRVWFMF